MNYIAWYLILPYQNMRVIQEKYPKLFYRVSSQYVHQFFLLNIDDNSHYTCFLSLKFFASLRLVMTLRWIQVRSKYKTYYLNYFCKKSLWIYEWVDLIVINFVIILFEFIFSLIIIKKLPEQKTCQTFGDQSGTFALSRWEPWHYQIVTDYILLIWYFFKRRRLMSKNGFYLMNALTIVVHRSSQ